MTESKRVRSMTEIRFAAEAEPCPGCGLHGLGEIKVVGAGDAWSMAFDCPRCGKRRGWQFTTRGSPIGVAHDRFELGPGASELLSAAQLLAELDRVAPVIVDQPGGLAAAAWRAAAAASDRARIALNELRKQVAAGPGGTDPRLTATWLDGELARQREIAARYDADAPRIWALEKTDDARSPAPPKGELTPATLRAHEQWVKAGKRGAGRLELERVTAAGARLGAVMLAGARLVDVDLTGAYLHSVELTGAELRGVDLAGAGLSLASFRTATLDGGSFAGADLQNARFDGATIDRTDFAGANLDTSSWVGTRVRRASLNGVALGHANLDGSAFVGCNLSGARLAPTGPRRPASACATRFEDCDLRDTDWTGAELDGTTFLRCLLAGAHGAPQTEAGVVVTDCDVSATQLRAQLGPPSCPTPPDNPVERAEYERELAQRERTREVGPSKLIK
jgi:uncharacterized protein YjbI with pentapeptide repeats